MTLVPGGIISYSAGSTQTGPDGFRVLSRIGPFNTSSPAMRHWLGRWAGHVPMLVQAYPATLGEFAAGVVVDTYLSARVASRAFQLAARESMPVILASQPLLAADLLFAHAVRGYNWPRDMLLLAGGYPLPQSLERVLVNLAADQSCRLDVLQAYGMAEVDAGCLLAAMRDEQGQPVYHLRGDDVRVKLVDGRVRLARTDGDWHETGDGAEWTTDGGLIFQLNPARAYPATLAELEAWDEAAWRRRTGFLVRCPRWQYQLRQGYEPATDREQSFHVYAAHTDMSWLVKPDWS